MQHSACPEKMEGKGLLHGEHGLKLPHQLLIEKIEQKKEDCHHDKAAEILPGLKLAEPIVKTLAMDQPKNILHQGFAGFLKTMIFMALFNRIKHFIEEHGIIHQLEKGIKYLSTRPLIAMPIFTVFLAMATPVMIFVFFALVTSAISFTSFLLAEGAILGMAGIILACFLLATFGVSLVVGTVFSVLYVGLQKLRIVK